MKTEKLAHFYTADRYVTASMIDEPLLKAVSEGVKEIEVTKDEFFYVMQFGIGNSVYQYVIQDKHEPYHMVLGMKLKII